MTALSPIDIARAAWGADLPDWIAVVAEKCVDTTQREVAARLGYSAGMVNQLLRRRYKGNLVAIEDAVRGAWMGHTVVCPVKGLIPTDTCQAWIRKSGTFAPTNNDRVRMYRACRACPRREGGS